MATTAAAHLKAALAAGGCSARSAARRIGGAPARLSEIQRGVHDPSVGTLDRILGGIGWQLVALPTLAPSAAAVAWSIREAVERRVPDLEDRALRSVFALSDGLAAAEPAVRVALCVTPPIHSGEPRFDAAIAAVVDHHLTAAGLPRPGWLDEPSRSLGDAWVPDPYAGPSIRAETSAAFRRHGVLIAERELVST